MLTREEIQAIVRETMEGLRAEQEAADKAARDLMPPEVAAGTEMDNVVRAQAHAPGNTAEERSLFIARCVRAVAAGDGDVSKGAWIAKNRWHDDAVNKALAAGDADAGGMWISPAWSADLIELLAARAVFRGAGPRVLPLMNGHLTQPKVASGATAAYTGENTNIEPSQATSSQITLTAKKLVALTPISNDLLRYDSVAADAFVRDDMIESLRRREDLAFLRGDGTAHTPKGLKSWCLAASLVTCNTTVNLVNVTNDVRNIVLKLRSNNVGMVKPVWFMSPRTEMYLKTVRDSNGNLVWHAEMATGKFWGYPFFSTTQIPENLGAGVDSELYLVDMAEMILGDAMMIRVDTSTEAAYYDGSAVAAAFSKDQTVIRAISEHDLVPRHDEAIAMGQTVRWGT